jgi:hypothetical protein
MDNFVNNWPTILILIVRVRINHTLGTDHLTCRGGGLWFFVSFRIFFSDNARVRIFIFFVARGFFFQKLTLGYMTKTLIQIFFFLQQNQNIFFSNIGNQNIFLDNKHTPPPPFKLNGRSLNIHLEKKWWFETGFLRIFFWRIIEVKQTMRT